VQSERSQGSPHNGIQHSQGIFRKGSREAAAVSRVSNSGKLAWAGDSRKIFGRARLQPCRQSQSGKGFSPCGSFNPLDLLQMFQVSVQNIPLQNQPGKLPLAHNFDQARTLQLLDMMRHRSRGNGLATPHIRALHAARRRSQLPQHLKASRIGQSFGDQLYLTFRKWLRFRQGSLRAPLFILDVLPSNSMHDKRSSQ